MRRRTLCPHLSPPLNTITGLDRHTCHAAMTNELNTYVPGPNSWAKPGSAERNKVELLPVLSQWFTGAALNNGIPIESRRVLELASGFGTQISYFAEYTPSVTFQPTEAQDECIEAMKAVAEQATNRNILPPAKLNVVSDTDWLDVVGRSDSYDGIFVLNMLHISVWESTEKLFLHAGRILRGGKKTAFLAVYGAFKRNGEYSGEGDRLFDIDLKRRDARWAIRDLESEVIPVAEKNGFKLKECLQMNFNNLLVIWILA
ncbi:uncharacterized protein V1513DRAFT_451700 [Lipomyces chichibuensis]|uniref:uncharacterized protein n=1 Tax=Lipomyces chichibuensis TaxID=1546026 RepID=UPI003343C1EE